jgi:hypothetical protein
MIVKGGRTNYGEDIGILMLDTVFPRLLGDVGNAATYSFPVRYKIVRNASLKKVMRQYPVTELLAPFIQAAKELEAEGVKAITTSCGFLAPFQRELADAVNVPVFTSSLMMAPWIAAMLGKGKKVAVFTERAEILTDEHFLKVGWSLKQVPVVVKGMPADAYFPKIYSDDGWEADTELLSRDMENMAREQMTDHPETGAILFECTNMGPFAATVQRITEVPVFGINQLIFFVHSAVSAIEFRHF